MAEITWLLDPEEPFPQTDQALHDPEGLLAASPTLTIERLLAAYPKGIFPWYEEGQPVLWWSPDPRSVLFTDSVRITRSLSRVLKRDIYQVSLNRAFSQVIRACAGSRKDSTGTWISPEMMSAYQTLHEAGIAHSVETWRDGNLVGGLYGICLGKIFFGESMFHHATDASKVALAHLARLMSQRGCPLIDCQVHNDHLASLGAVEIPRAQFEQYLQEQIPHTHFLSGSDNWLPGWDVSETGTGGVS